MPLLSRADENPSPALVPFGFTFPTIKIELLILLNLCWILLIRLFGFRHSSNNWTSTVRFSDHVVKPDQVGAAPLRLLNSHVCSRDAKLSMGQSLPGNARIVRGELLAFWKGYFTLYLSILLIQSPWYK